MLVSTASMKCHFEEIEQLVESGGLSLKDVILACKGIIDGKYPVRTSPAGLEKIISKQIERHNRLNQLFRWGLPQIGELPDGVLSSYKPMTLTERLVIVPYLPPADGQSGLERTIYELTRSILLDDAPKLAYGQNISRETLKDVKSLPAGEFQPGVKLIAVDMYSHIDYDRSSVSFDPSNNSSPKWTGVEALAFALHNHKWIELIKDGDINPQPVIAGLQVEVGEGENKKLEMLTLGLNIGDKKKELVLGTTLPATCLHHCLPTYRVICELS